MINLIKKLMCILYTILLNHFRQEFSVIFKSIKRNFGIRVPVWVGITIYLISQYSIIIFLLIGLDYIKGSNIWIIIIIIVLTLNFILPFTMGRLGATRMLDDPLQYLFWQSPLNRMKLFIVWLISDTFLFWMREFSIQIFALFAIIQMSDNWVISIMLVLSWFIIISFNYMITVYKNLMNEWYVIRSISKLQELLYILRLLLIGGLMGMIMYLLFIPVINNPISSNITMKNINNEMHQFVNRIFDLILGYIDISYSMVANNMWFIIGILGIMILFLIVHFYSMILNLNRLFISGNRVSEVSSTSIIFRLYIWISSKVFPKNIWLKRDLILIDRLRIHTQMPLKFQYLIPPSTATLPTLVFIFVTNLSASGFILSLWFVTALLLYQITWLIQYAHPVLNPSSELRQIDLLHLSPYYSYGEFMQSKTKLLIVLIMPYQIFLSAIYLISSMLTKSRFMEVIVGFIGLWLLFITISILSTWWLAYTARFDFKNILAVDNNSSDIKLLRTLYSLPKRLIIVSLIIPFLIVIFTDFNLVNRLMYSTFSFLVLITLICSYLYEKIKKLN